MITEREPKLPGIYILSRESASDNDKTVSPITSQ